MHFKNHKQACVSKGFTLIETLLAVAIMGIILSPIFILHGAVLKRVGRASASFNVLLQGKHLMGEARQKQEPGAQEFSLDKKSDNPVATLRYELQKGLDKKSSLASFEGLHKELVTMTWNDQGQQRHERLVTFTYKKPEQKKT